MDPLGDMKGTQLGALTNEIPEGKKLVEVVCMTPKVYSLKMEDVNGELDYTVKAKGMTLNYGNAQIINHTSMAERVSYGRVKPHDKIKSYRCMTSTQREHQNHFKVKCSHSNGETIC